jgi:predicted transcriptional regulator
MPGYVGYNNMRVNDTEAPWDAVAYVRASSRRRSVFESLAESPKSATEIAEELGIGRQAVSQHIGQLRSGNEMGEDHDLVASQSGLEFASGTLN